MSEQRKRDVILARMLADSARINADIVGRTYRPPAGTAWAGETVVIRPHPSPDYVCLLVNGQEVASKAEKVRAVFVG